MKTIDMRGKPCPMPVVSAKKELEKADSVQILVDNILAVQNLKRMADGIGYGFTSIVENIDSFIVTIFKEENAEETENSESPAAAKEGATVLITSDRLGNGSDELGRILIKGFLFSLTELSVPPKAVIFINSGVHLATEGSNTIADLQVLSGKGTKILVCGTCLNYYKLTDKLAAGEVTNMMEIAGLLTSAAKLVTL